jgi:IS605 OrfB family transposase
MQLTETLKLKLSKTEYNILTSMMSDYISAVNSLVSLAISGTSIQKYSSKDVDALLPSAVRAQVAQDARSIVKKHYKSCHKTVLQNRKELKKPLTKKHPKTVLHTAPNLPIVKKPCCYWNNQNFKLYENGILSFPVWLNGKSTTLMIPTTLTERQKSILFNTKLGTMRIVFKNKKLVAQVVYEVKELESLDGHVMGVDLGIKCPAVSYVDTGKVKFYGNGRKNKYMKRFYRHQRKKLQKVKKIDVVRRINDKEQRIMKDIDHTISCNIIKEAVKQGVTTIKLEQLANIRSTARKSRKNNHSLHTWSFYRLAQFIEYKAKLAGITVQYVNPAYTSQTCPKCGAIHHADDRNYVCNCGFHKHRDIVGAMNISQSTVIVGNRLSA